MAIMPGQGDEVQEMFGRNLDALLTGAFAEWGYRPIFAPRVTRKRRAPMRVRVRS